MIDNITKIRVYYYYNIQYTQTTHCIIKFINYVKCTFITNIYFSPKHWQPNFSKSQQIYNKTAMGIKIVSGEIKIKELALGPLISLQNLFISSYLAHFVLSNEHFSSRMNIRNPIHSFRPFAISFYIIWSRLVVISTFNVKYPSRLNTLVCRTVNLTLCNHRTIFNIKLTSITF